MSSLFARLAALLPLCACGTEGSDAVVLPPPHVATLDITIEGDPSIDPTKVQVAIVWFRDRAVFPARQLEPQELLVVNHSLSWPLHIEAELTEPPPYDPFYSAPTVGSRPGMLVAYLDDNANGHLDFTPVTAGAFVDRLIAYRPDTRIVHYSTVDVIAQSVYVSNVGLQDVDVSTPITLLARAEPRQSCHLLADWRPYFAYQRVFGGIPIDQNEASVGPWDYEAEGDSPCPGGVAPDDTDAVSCDEAPLYAFHAKAIAQTSSFISQTCGQVMRVCQVRRANPNAPGPWLCPCDPSLYTCVPYEGGL